MTSRVICPTSQSGWCQLSAPCQKPCTPRFTVLPVYGMGYCKSGWTVFDEQTRDETAPFTWREDAEHLARQLNRQHQQEEGAIAADLSRNANKIIRADARALREQSRDPHVMGQTARFTGSEG